MRNPCRLSRVAVLAILTGFGCQNDEIQNYKVAKQETLPRPAAKNTAGGEQRLLAAVVPSGDRTWFFKLVGPSADVEGVRESFDKYLKSIRFPEKGDKPVTWTLPADWKEEPGSELRFATIRIGPKEKGIELTVVPLGKQAGSILDNINRWRSQLGVKAITEAELITVSRDFKWEGGEGLYVDMTGPGSGKMGKPPFAGRVPPFASGGDAPARPAAAAAPTPREPSKAPFKYTTPPGWKDVPITGYMSRAAYFQVIEGKDMAEVTVMPLAGEAGGLLANVNRWRGQINLGPVNEEQMKKDIRQITVSGIASPYADLLGAETAGGKRQRMLVVSVPLGDNTWFFKMLGPADLVARQKPAFEALMASIRFE